MSTATPATATAGANRQTKETTMTPDQLADLYLNADSHDLAIAAIFEAGKAAGTSDAIDQYGRDIDKARRVGRESGLETAAQIAASWAGGDVSPAVIADSIRRAKGHS